MAEKWGHAQYLVVRCAYLPELAVIVDGQKNMDFPNPIPFFILFRLTNVYNNYGVQTDQPKMERKIIKTIRVALAAVFAAGAAYAGSAVFVAPEVAGVEEPMRSGSGAWLIPLAIIAILALTLTGKDDPQSSL